MKKNRILVLAGLYLASCVHSDPVAKPIDQANNFAPFEQREPAQTGIVAEALPPALGNAPQWDKMYKEYCTVNRNGTDIPLPNYKNSEVYNAAKKLAMIRDQSFYFYSGPLFIYGLRTGKELNEAPASFPATIQEFPKGKKNAHAFLTVLCGEFRDRPTMIRAKLRWASKIHTLDDVPQPKINITTDHVWSKMSARSYANYIRNTNSIYEMKKDFRERSKVTVGTNVEPEPVEPFSVCETKYIFKAYVEKGKFHRFNEADGENPFQSFKEYRNAVKKFSENCTPEDREYVYDFRGDSNYKPNSPESNGMIWYSSAIANSCVRGADGKLMMKDSVRALHPNPSICEDYFKTPFAHRWMAARAGLATWLFNSKETDHIFNNSSERVYIRPSYSNLGMAFDYGDGGDLNNEVAVKLQPLWIQNAQEFWKRPDLGFNEVYSSAGVPDKGTIFEKLRNSVNRHTDWYASGYEDGIDPRVRKDQAYSPFVASSYEMSASNMFTSPGITVGSPSDGCKHWMFVFKIKKENWFSVKSIREKKKVNFNTHWFDETSLGTNGLADSERAFDRLGTPLEEELDSIMYLNNISHNSNKVKMNCGENFVK